MKKAFKLENLDCAVCAQKMEDGVKKVCGVNNASVSFMSQRMIIDFSESADVERVFNDVAKVCKKIEPDCVIKK